MVRKDPLNERGPAPAGGRPQKAKMRVAPESIFQLRPLEEYEKLWGAVVQRAGDGISGIESFVTLGVPGVPLHKIKNLHKRLSQIVDKYEASDESV